MSVVCATYRRPGAVARLLAALAAQDLGAPFEVILSDDGSGADVVAQLSDLVSSSPLDVRFITGSRNRGAATARNAGWRAARAPVVAFTDDDCQPTPGWLREGLAALEPGAVVVGKVEPDPAQAGATGPWSRSLTVKDARYFQTANAFYSRADLEAAGGFDARLARGGEDTDLGLRVVALGRRAVFAPQALVRHDVRADRPWQVVHESATRWIDLALVPKKHPAVRSTLMHHRVFWKKSHPATLAALLGFVFAPATPWSLLLVAPWVVERGVTHPRLTAPRARVRWLGWTFLVDAAEVVGCLRGSLKHRTVFL